MKRIFLALALAAFLPFAASGQEDDSRPDAGGIKVSLGPSYRHFRNVHFEKVATPAYKGFLDAYGNLHDYAGIRHYVDSQIGTSGPLRFLDVTVVDFGSTAIGSHGGYGDGESTGFNLGLAVPLWKNESLSLNAVVNFQYFSLSSSAGNAFHSPGNACIEHYFTGSVAAPYTDPSDLVLGLSGNARSRFALDLFVFDAGFSLGYNLWDRLTTYLSGGPSLSLADMESSTYATLATDGTQPAVHREEKKERECEWGLYAAIGAAYQISKTVGLAAEFRYDEAFGTVGTRLAKQDLDGWGGTLKLLFTF
ncbi:MAG: hypothetical protein ACI4SG_07190 [Oligosphaeraceae bacterium]